MLHEEALRWAMEPGHRRGRAGEAAKPPRLAVQPGRVRLDVDRVGGFSRFRGSPYERMRLRPLGVVQKPEDRTRPVQHFALYPKQDDPFSPVSARLSASI